MRIRFLLLLVFTSLGEIFLHAQPFTSPNTYRSASNPHYWKNRPPYPAYWQQDVHYQIEAVIDDENTLIDGKSYTLTYWNNSPYALNELFFHLYDNAFVPGSHYHDLYENNHNKTKFGKNASKGLGITTEDWKVNGQPVAQELDNTILKLLLNKPLKSGDSATITCRFKTYWDLDGSMRRRSKTFNSWENKQKDTLIRHFDGVHWYPIVCVYDAKFGWTTDQHLDKEFYANFGTFDVALTFPQEYVVEATGVLVNQAEVLPVALRQKLDLSNFKKVDPKTPPSVITPRVPGKTKTWVFHAENVHNFAFTADPTYRIGERVWNGIRLITLAQEKNAPGWQTSGYFLEHVIRTYSTDFGMYDWPKIIIADAKDGMEYPMLTLDNGTWPGHQGLIAHEVGHMWFYGMIGSNETYRALLDEGFTEFLETWHQCKFQGEKYGRYLPGNKYYSAFLDSGMTRIENSYLPYLGHVTEGYDEPINTHSSMFNGSIRHGGNYGLVYYKTTVMLYNLQYVLGDSLFQNAMRYYVSKWKFCHPYPEDFRQSIIEYTHTDLNWFFDQWLETTKYIDYGIRNIQKVKDSPDTWEIEFFRKGRMQMPLDFTVTTQNGQRYDYLIPNLWFVKDSTKRKVLPRWYGWDLLHPSYTARITLPGKIKKVEIDPSLRLADIDLSNNSLGRPGFRSLQFDHRVPNTKRWDLERVYLRPDLWYNALDGLQVGLHAEGSYFNKRAFALSLWGNTTLGYQETGAYRNKYMPLAFNLTHRYHTNRLWPQSSTSQQLYYNAGIWKAQAGFEKIIRKQDARNPRFTRLFLNSKYLINHASFESYLLYPELWGYGDGAAGKVNGTLSLGIQRRQPHGSKANGDYTLQLRVPSLRSDYNFSSLQSLAIHNLVLSKLDLRLRLFAQWSPSKQIPLESSVYMAGASPEELIENNLTRATGFVPGDWLGYGAIPNSFQQGGGLNLRGYAGMWVTEKTSWNGKDTTVSAYLGRGGLSWNLELDLDRLVKIRGKKFWKPLHLDTYLFSDMGVLQYQSPKGVSALGTFRADAGVGTALSIRFSPYDLKPIVLRFDMPLYLSHPGPGEGNLQFRYVVGVGRSF